MYSFKYWVTSILVSAAADGSSLIFADSFERIDTPRVTVHSDGALVPAEMAGDYDEYFNCALGEGGGSSGGVDHGICYRKIDGSSWRIWNTGCGWEIGRLVEDDFGSASWERHARTYSGQCSLMPSDQISTRALIDNNTFFNSFGEPISGVLTELCEHTHVEVTSANPVPVLAEMAGLYDKAFDCVLAEGGASSGGVDQSICFRKTDGSSWRIWNTGCGWEIGRLVEGDLGDVSWERHARTYSGQCSAMPPAQIDTRALSTTQYLDGFGDPIEGVASRRLETASCE